MTTITASPDAATGSVTLTINQTSSVTGVDRTDANGTFGVRAAAGQIPTPGTGTTIVTDYEARNGINTYTAHCHDITYRTNLCTNPSFETGTAGWILSGVTATTTTAFPAMVKSGTRILHATSTGTSASPYVRMDSLPVTAGQWFALKAFLASEAAGNIQVRLAIIFQDAASTVLAQVNTNYAKASFYAGAYHQLVAEAPASTAKANIYLQFRNGDDTVNPVPSGQRLWADAVQAYSAATQAAAQAMLDPGYFDGSTTPDSDHEYAWTGTAHGSTSVETLHTREVSVSAVLDLLTPWLMVPVAPNYSEPVETITNYSGGRETASTVHRIIGRPDPLVVMGKLGTRAGSLEIFADSLADAERIVRVFDRGEAVLLKQDIAGMDMYLIAESLDVSPFNVDGPDATKYRLTIRYQEVARPFGDLAGALGWTYEALAAAYVSYAAVSQEYASYDDLTLNDPK